MPNRTLTFNARTDVGIVRDHNEDAFGCFFAGGESAGDAGESSPGGDLIAVLSDGVGGHECGELASNLTVAGVGALLGHMAVTENSAEPETLRARIETAVAGQNRHLCSVAGRMGQGSRSMAATLTAAWLTAGQLWMVHAGDSRLYRWRHGKLEQLSIDDTKAGYALAQGRTPEEVARAGAKWHVIERAMGVNEAEFAVTIKRFEVKDGDVYLLCSDGLTAGLSNSQLERGFDVSEPMDLSAFSERLIKVGNQASGRDNITVVLVQIGEGWSAVAASGVNSNAPT